MPKDAIWCWRTHQYIIVLNGDRWEVSTNKHGLSDTNAEGWVTSKVTFPPTIGGYHDANILCEQLLEGDGP